MLKLLATAFLLMGVLAAVSAAQSVQLPTFHQFSASTTVVVPDRGSVLLGGVNRAASGGNQFGGFPGNRSLGGASSASGASVRVWIHDFDAMDRALLEEARAKRLARAPQVRGGGTVSLPRRGTDGVLSVAEIHHRNSLVQPTDRDAQALLQRAADAEAKGNLGAARVYLQMAARKATGPLREQAMASYQRLAR